MLKEGWVDGRILFYRRPFAGICAYSRGFITAPLQG